MKKTEVSINEELVVLDGSHADFNFIADDIITSYDPKSKWCNKNVRVLGFSENKLWGVVVDAKGQSLESPFKASDSRGLVLLQRPGYRFRVGDDVNFTDPYTSNVVAGSVVAIDPRDQTTNEDGPEVFLIKLDDSTPISVITNLSEYQDYTWLSDSLKTSTGKFSWAMESYLELIKPAKRIKLGSIPDIDAISDSDNQDGGLMESLKDLPSWFASLVSNWRARTAHTFVFHGNINDFVPMDRGQYLSLSGYLSRNFSTFKYVMFYSLADGLTFANEDMSKDFRATYLNANQPAPGGVAGNMAQQLRQDASLADLIGKTPDRVFPILTDVFHNVNEPDAHSANLNNKQGRKILIIDFAHDIFFSSQSPSVNDRVNLEMITKWARDNRIRENGHLIVLLTPNLINIHSDLRANDSGVVFVRIPKPNEAERLETWNKAIADFGIEVGDGVTAEILARITNGLSRRQIENIAKMSKTLGQKLSVETIRQAKEEILQKEFGDRLKIKVPKRGFENFGGKEDLKKYFRNIIDNLIKGIRRRIPMGILIPGPPGTGKTCFLECFAKESGFTVVELGNMRNMFVGESERIAEEVFAALDDLAPVIVIEDEADQSETSRDSYQGDSGVSNRIRQMKFTFCSDPERRGKVLWFRLTNRADLLDAAYKRKGRSDEIVPFVLPKPSEYADIFKVMFQRYEIPTTITDFAPFGQAVASLNYVTGADVEWMALESDKLTGYENKEKVDPEDLYQAINHWELPLDPREIDEQIVLAIEKSSKQLRPDNWQELLKQAKERLGLVGTTKDVNSSVATSRRRSDVHHE